MKPMMPCLPYRLQDTPHFLRMLKEYNEQSEGEHGEDIILSVWDIESMYPNIDNALGLEACAQLFDEREEQTPTTDCLIEAIKITLQENIAEFNNIVVKQKSGTAMGPHHACSYADAAVDKAIDRKVMSDENPWRSKMRLWGRFRDDIFGIWTCTAAELHLFNDWLNRLQPKLKFTMESSQDSVVFLDLKVSVVNRKISTSMYSKSSDTHAYLLPSSRHPTHICKNIPKGVMKRVRRNCSDDIIRTETYQEYKQYLLEREYNVDLIEEAIAEAEQVSRLELMGVTDENNPQEHTSRKIPLIMKFNPRLPFMSKFIRENLHVLSLNPDTARLFNSNTLFVSFKMEQNILSMITKKIEATQACCWWIRWC